MDYPMIFNTENVRAILAGRKTQTRRLFKLPKWSTGNWDDFELDDDGLPMAIREEWLAWDEVKSPLAPGDRLWVKETWAVHHHYNHYKPSKLSPDHHSLDLSYRADWQEDDKPGYLGKVRPSIFLPQWASRILLPVKRVWYERLQDISQRDVLAEGIEMPDDGLLAKFDPIQPLKFHPELEREWIRLWDSINAKRGHPWSANDWVRVTEFEYDENGKEQ